MVARGAGLAVDSARPAVARPSLPTAGLAVDSARPAVARPSLPTAGLALALGVLAITSGCAAQSYDPPPEPPPVYEPAPSSDEPAPTSSEPAPTSSEPAPTSREPVATPPPAPRSTVASFVRLVSARVGGDFDLGDDEEVVARLIELTTSRRSRLCRVQADLPYTALREVIDPHPPWVEVSDVEEVTMRIEVVDDDDLLGEDDITRTLEPLALRREAFGVDGAPRRLEVPLATIVWGEHRIEGASLTLELLRAPRRDVADDASRAAIARDLERLLALTAPEVTADAEAVGDALRASADDARRMTLATTHTYLRSAAYRLASDADSLGTTCAHLGMTPADRLRKELERLAAKAAALSPEDRATAGITPALLAFTADPVERADVATLQRLADAAAALGRADPDADTFPRPPGASQTLHDYRRERRSAQRQLESAATSLRGVGATLADLQARIRAELGR